MLTKFLSLTLAAGSVYIYLESRLHPGDLLYLFASNNIVVNAILISIAALSIRLAFMRKKSFDHWYSFAGCTALAILLVSFGIVGAFFSDLDYSFADILLPVNYIMLIEAGVIIGISALSNSHAAAPNYLKNFYRKPILIINNVAGFMPKFPRLQRPQLPSGGRRIRPA